MKNPFSITVTVRNHEASSKDLRVSTNFRHYLKIFRLILRLNENYHKAWKRNII